MKFLFADLRYWSTKGEEADFLKAIEDRDSEGLICQVSEVAGHSDKKQALFDEVRGRLIGFSRATRMSRGSHVANEPHEQIEFSKDCGPLASELVQETWNQRRCSTCVIATLVHI